jgi:hypothetical protein
MVSPDKHDMFALMAIPRLACRMSDRKRCAFQLSGIIVMPLGIVVQLVNMTIGVIAGNIHNALSTVALPGIPCRMAVLLAIR